jgi:hypothetical protein
MQVLYGRKPGYRVWGVVHNAFGENERRRGPGLLFGAALTREKQGVEMSVAFFVEAFALAVGLVSVRNDLDMLDVE